MPILGPYGWPKREGAQSPLTTTPGVYLMTVYHKDGYMPFGVGVTRRPPRERFMEHTREYNSGWYHILDLEEAQRGTRKVTWEGWKWTPQKRADYEARRDSIVALAERQMTATSVFVIDTSKAPSEAPRVQERLEAAIIIHNYKFKDTLFDSAGRGMQRAPRRDSEEPMLVTLQSNASFYRLPSVIEI